MQDSHLLVRAAAMSIQRVAAVCSVERLPYVDSRPGVLSVSPH